MHVISLTVDEITMQQNIIYHIYQAVSGIFELYLAGRVGASAWNRSEAGTAAVGRGENARTKLGARC